jgi:hypothetical protein
VIAVVAELEDGREDLVWAKVVRVGSCRMVSVPSVRGWMWSFLVGKGMHLCFDTVLCI